MVDVVDRKTRSRMMSGIRGKDTHPEMVVRKFLHARGLRYRLHVTSLPGKPDMVFVKHRVALFVHGCFWHRHLGCKFATKPESNAAFWQNKFDANIRRDNDVAQKLSDLGWRVLVIWECETRNEKNLAELHSKITGHLL